MKTLKKAQDLKIGDEVFFSATNEYKKIKGFMNPEPSWMFSDVTDRLAFFTDGSSLTLGKETIFEVRW